MVRVLIVEDEPATLAALSAAVEGAEDLTLLAAETTLSAGMARLGEAPELALVDLRLGTDSGIDLIQALRAETEAKILVITMFGDEASTVAAIEAGADGYLLKGDPRIDIAAEIRAVLAGEAPISPAIARHLLKRMQAPAPVADPLTPRERQVLEALAVGESYKEVARRYDLSIHTVNFHVRALYKKLSARSRGEAVKIALAAGMIRLGP